MRVIGTAGHIDHGKSSLVQALTGINPDRLPEEKARGMTIELGFAWLELAAHGVPDPVGVVDVPGHERFVRQMLAGSGGIDLALLVIAADEGIMPQTREHLAILDLLEVRFAVVALTKCDLVDQEWLDLVAEDVRATLAATTLGASPIVPCSSVSGEGLDHLRAALAAALLSTPEPIDRGQPRLPIDRVFTRSGFGTVVTGTLLDGGFALGDEVEIAPAGLRGRIRGLQSHHAALDLARPGRRLAMNIAGLTLDEIRRGMVVCRPGAITPAWHLDLRVRVVGERRDGHAARSLRAGAPGDEADLEHNMEVVLHTGAAEARARLRLLDAERLGPGEQGWAQLALDQPIAARRGDRCVLRIPSPAATVGGGVIVAINPPRYRRFAAQTIARLSMIATATPEVLALDALAHGPVTAALLAKRLDLDVDAAAKALLALADRGAAEQLALDSWVATAWMRATADRALETLEAHHARFPLQRGMGGEALRAVLGVERRIWPSMLDRWRAERVLEGEDDLLRRPGFEVTLTPAQARLAGTLLTDLTRAPYAPPSLGGADAEREVLSALIDRGDVVRLAVGLFLARRPYEQMRDWILDAIGREGQVTVAMLRDQFDTSRRIAQALLEYLDGLRVTRRIGDAHVRGSAARAAGGGDVAVPHL